MQANTYRILLQNVKVICEKKRELVPLHNHHACTCVVVVQNVKFSIALELQKIQNDVNEISIEFHCCEQDTLEC